MTLTIQLQIKRIPLKGIGSEYNEKRTGRFDYAWSMHMNI